MKTGKKDITGNGLFTMSRLGPAELTHKSVENYLSKGRCMQSAYVCELLCRLYRLLKTVLTRKSGWLGAIADKKHRRRIGIPMNRKYYY